VSYKNVDWYKLAQEKNLPELIKLLKQIETLEQTIKKNQEAFGENKIFVSDCSCNCGCIRCQ
jgi:hypothetical protein